VGKKLNKKDLLSTNLATKKGYCTQRFSIRLVRDFKAANLSHTKNLIKGNSNNLAQTRINFMLCYSQLFNFYGTD
jgi:hypothetical protein